MRRASLIGVTKKKAGVLSLVRPSGLSPDAGGEFPAL